MKRRKLLKLAASSAALSPCMSPLAGAAVKGEGAFEPGDWGGVTPAQIRALFDGGDKEALKLIEDIMGKCVLDRILPPRAPMKQNWVYPGGPYYKGQWIWDSMFVVDLLSLLPGKEKVIREIFQNYWDFQDRWNKEMPAYARDMITVAIKTEPQPVRQFSQIPILAWGVERVYRRNADKELIEQCLGRLEKFHDWFWRERDVNEAGLCCVGSYSGKVQHARWETFDYECNMDALKLTKHPTRRGRGEGEWYGDISVVGNTSYLIMGERSLVRLAEIAGDTKMAARRQLRIDKAVKAMRQHMWDEEKGVFLSVGRDTLIKVPVATISSWLPLTAGVPTKAMAKRMAEVIATPAWQTPLPVPTVERADRRWKSRGFWRGDVWPSTNYQIACGFADFGYKEIAADIADKTVANAIKNGIYEHYDSATGEGIGIKDYCMSSSIGAMMLDGLTSRYPLELRS